MSTILEACALCDGGGAFVFQHEKWRAWEKGTWGEYLGTHGKGRMKSEMISESCPTCRGQGRVAVPTDGDGQSIPCTPCGGGGRKNRDSGEPDDREKPVPCDACYGSGWTGFRPGPD